MIKEAPIIEGRTEPGWCGIACLAYVSILAGQPLSQRFFYDYLKPDIENWGTDGEEMKKGAEMFGEAEWVQTDLKSLKQCLLRGDIVIINYMSGSNYLEDGHYSILESVGDDTITIQDPEWIGSRKEMRRDLFEKVWFDFDQDGNKLERWALVIRRDNEAS